MNLHRHVIVYGLVQGVTYRAWTQMTALEHGVEGWVRNRRDGSVEAVLSGAEDAVSRMIEGCRHGPPGARVASLDQREASAEEIALRRRGELFSVLGTV